MRKKVMPGKEYNANRDYFVLFANAYIVTGLCDFFGMKTINDLPTKNGFPKFKTDGEKWPWLHKTIRTFIAQYAFPKYSGHDETHPNVVLEASRSVQNVTVRLANGQEVQIPVGVRHEEVIGQQEKDSVKDYAHLTMELGMTFKYFLCHTHSPNRDKFLALLKLMMLQLKARNPQAKYPLEILRFLVQQYSLLGEDEAQQVFFASFVNTKGKPQTFMPADLMMEWVVRQNKRHIKHMFANKSHENILKRSESLTGIADICQSLDLDIYVIRRLSGHTSPSSDCDEAKVICDLLQLNPFIHTPGRKHIASMIDQIDGVSFNSWFFNKKYTFRP